ncbi:DUF1778 domain-containing protein [Myroides odoratimimus]|uniref:type II toxin -antitoxin system TacA 1-like antitoxin n=1 Tax=Myroides TaxID=76831 RepID=UPI000245F8AB|nr:MULTISPECIES: DUF1778 domain-containing protein [Myroides]AJA69464.1 Protein of unknown function DUF1778 [Myroides sp. A21]EHO12838.1 hypothetical protein HMPREF9714_01208 [Myroides odoratimimus CCUG 12901]EKB03497.1 hypothetical protein HMPREF9711_02824 [Myroides odoratimimus CCUG 3837]MCA4793032.1 DUF1778 domain-containing protein [Myroides odoratimimus]MCA4806834.1 DUF1778 domain-containing protein [Myroides odoratimimus]
MNTIHKNNIILNKLPPIEQQALVETDIVLGGYQRLTDFILKVIKEKEEEHSKNNEVIITSERDAEVFIDAIYTIQEPSIRLIMAFKEYNTIINEG